jgi:hypothetical protein
MLVIDPMEELFTTANDPVSRAVFIRLLALLANSGSLWVTVRCGRISSTVAARFRPFSVEGRARQL